MHFWIQIKNIYKYWSITIKTAKRRQEWMDETWHLFNVFIIFKNQFEWKRLETVAQSFVEFAHKFDPEK